MRVTRELASEVYMPHPPESSSKPSHDAWKRHCESLCPQRNSEKVVAWYIVFRLVYSGCEQTLYADALLRICLGGCALQLVKYLGGVAVEERLARVSYPENLNDSCGVPHPFATVRVQEWNQNTHLTVSP